MLSEASNADIKSRCKELWSRRIGVFQMLPIRPRGNDGLKQVSTVKVMLKASAALAENCDNRDVLNFCFRRFELVSNQIQRGGHEHSLLYSHMASYTSKRRGEIRSEAERTWGRKRDTYSPRGDPSRVYTLLLGEKCTGYVTRSTSTTRRKQDVMIWLVAVDEWNGTNGE